MGMITTDFLSLTRESPTTHKHPPPPTPLVCGGMSMLRLKLQALLIILTNSVEVKFISYEWNVLISLLYLDSRAATKLNAQICDYCPFIFAVNN